MSHPNEEELFAYREGFLVEGERTTMETHVKECAECRAQLQRLEAAVSAMQAIPVPDPGEDYGRKVWQQIAPRLPEKRAPWWKAFLAPQRLALMGAAAALLIVAFVAGRFWHPGTPGSGQPGVEKLDEAQVRQRVLWLAVGEHLGRSEMLLTQLANAEPRVVGARMVNIAPEQRRAEMLLEDNRLYRQTALEAGDTALASTLDELERVLTDVANSPDQVSPARLVSMQKRMDSNGILFKVRVVEQSLRERRQSPPAPQQDNSTSGERNKV